MQGIGAGLRNDIHNAAQSAAVLCAKTVVHNAELLHRFLRRSRALGTCCGIDVVGAVNRNLIAEVSHPGKRNPGHFEFGDGRSDTGTTRRNPRRQ